MKTETEQLIERLDALKVRQVALRQELTALDAAEQRYAMALDVLRSLSDERSHASEGATSPVLRKRRVFVENPTSAVLEKGSSLAEMIVRHAFGGRDGLTTGEIVAAVQSALPSAKYASIVSVLSRLVHSGALLRREGKLVFLKK